MRHLLVSTILALACLARPLHAQPADDAKGRGDGEALTAQHLYEAGKYHDAATHFIAAYGLDPQPAYLFNTAQAYRFAKECANAASYFRQFLDATKQVQAQNLDKVNRYLEEMDTCAKAEAGQPAPAPQQDVVKPVEPAPQPVPAEPSDPGRGKRRLGLAIGAAGVVGVALGAYFTSRVYAAHDDAQSWITKNCTPCSADALAAAQKQYDDQGHQAETREAIAYTVGVAALAGGVVLYMLGHASGERAVAAVPTQGGAMVTAGLSF